MRGYRTAQVPDENEPASIGDGEDMLRAAERDLAAATALEAALGATVAPVHNLSAAKTPARVDDAKALDVTPACHAIAAAR